MEIKLFWTEQLTSQIRADTVIIPLDGKRLIKVSTGTPVKDTVAQQSQLSIKHLSFIILIIYMKRFIIWLGQVVRKRDFGDGSRMFKGRIVLIPNSESG